jgi:uncharacterized protein
LNYIQLASFAIINYTLPLIINYIIKKWELSILRANLQLIYLQMEYRSIKGFTALAQFGFLCAFLGLGFVIAGGIQFILTLQVLPKGVSISDTDEIMKAMLAPENIGMARASQVLGTLGLLFVPALLWNYVSNGKSLLWLGFSKHISAWQIILGSLIIYTAAMAATPLADISKSIIAHFPSIDASAKRMEDLYNEQALALSNLKNVPEYITGLFIMAFFPAMFEEVFFRGTLQNLFVKWWQKPLLAIFATSIIFSLIHMSIYLFLSRMLLGFVLGLMYHKTKNIWVNIIAHFINNALALTYLFVQKNKVGKLNLKDMEEHIHWAFGLVAIVALVGLFIMLTKYSTKNKAKIEDEERILYIGNLK